MRRRCRTTWPTPGAVLPGAPAKALLPLVNVRETAERQDGSLFNDAQFYDQATKAALHAQSEVFKLLADERLWRRDATPSRSSGGSGER